MGKNDEIGVKGKAKLTYTIDDEQLATYILTSATGKEDRRACKVVWVAPTTCGDAGRDLLGADGVGEEGLVHVRIDVAGDDGIDVDVVGGPLVCEGLDELSHTTLCARIGGDGEAALVGEEGGDEDNLSLAVGEHVCPCCAGKEECRGEVDGDDLEVVVGN